MVTNRTHPAVVRAVHRGIPSVAVTTDDDHGGAGAETGLAERMDQERRLDRLALRLAATTTTDGRLLFGAAVGSGHQQMTLGLFLLVDDPFGRLEDLVIDGRHHGQRDVERAQRGVDLVAKLLTHLTLVILSGCGEFHEIGQRSVGCHLTHVTVVVVVVVAGQDAVGRWRSGWSVFVAQDEQRRQRNAGGRDPDEGDAGNHPGGGPFDPVVQRPGDGPVAVDADHAQVEDGRRARQDVEGHPSVAGAGAERPSAQHLVDQGHRHHQEGHAQVGHGQRHQQVIARAAPTILKKSKSTDFFF